MLICSCAMLPSTCMTPGMACQVSSRRCPLLRRATGRNLRGMPRKGEPTHEVATLGTRLKYARELRKLSQGELAERSGVDQGLISKLERKRRGGLDADTVVRLARGLGVPVGWLLASEGDAIGTGAQFDE